jgi:hypothetical protein
MTEAEWLISVVPQKMRQHLEESTKGGERKMRLFAVACGRRVEQWFVDPCQRSAVDVLERYADGIVSAEELRRSELLTGQIDEGHVALTADHEDRDQDALDAAFHTAQVVAQATCNDPRGDHEPTYYLRLYDTIMHTVETAGFAAVATDRRNGRTLLAREAERGVLATLLRDIFGNPFRPLSADPSWLTSTVVALASQMHESRDFSALPILADALQDAGCDNEHVLNHCRGPGPHVRGCWVVDLVLGKE